MSPTRPFFDAHLHVIDRRFPLSANDGFLPEEFTVAQYRELTVAALPAADRRPHCWG